MRLMLSEAFSIASSYFKSFFLFHIISCFFSNTSLRVLKILFWNSLIQNTIKFQCLRLWFAFKNKCWPRRSYIMSFCYVTIPACEKAANPIWKMVCQYCISQTVTSLWVTCANYPEIVIHVLNNFYIWISVLIIRWTKFFKKKINISNLQSGWAW